MKKYSILFFVAVAALFSVFFAGERIKATVKDITVTRLSVSTVNTTVLCSGKVEFAGGKDVRAEKNVVVSEMLVKEGDKIKKGDPLCYLTEYEISEEHINTNEISEDKILEALRSGDYSVIEEYQSGKAAEQTNEQPKGTVVTVYSPIEGVISTIKADEGSPLTKGMLILTVNEENNLRVRLSVNESKISDLKLGQQAKITGIGFKNSTYNGKITKIENQASQSISQSGKETTVDVLVSIDGAKSDIKPGYTANCEITTSIIQNAKLLPYTCVTADNDGKEFVYVMSHGEAVKRYIKTGGEFSEGLAVISGISEKDSIINESASVSESDRVRINKGGVQSD